MKLETHPKIFLNLLAAGLGGAVVGKFSGNKQGALYQGAAAAIGGIALPLIHKNTSKQTSYVSTAIYGLLLGGVGHLGRLPWKVNLAAAAAFVGAQAYISLQQGEGKRAEGEGYGSGSSSIGPSEPLTFPTVSRSDQDQLTELASLSGVKGEYVHLFHEGCQPNYLNGFYAPSHSRHSSANLERLVNLGTAQAVSYYPASHTEIGDNHVVVSEAPARVEGSVAGKAREAYYKMVVKVRSRVLASATTGYRVQGKVVTTYDAVHFLEPQEEIVFVHKNQKVTVKCDSEELFPLDESIADRAGLTREGAPLNYHVKNLKVQVGSQEPYTVIQVVPDFVAVSAPLELAISYVDLLEQLAKTHGLSMENLIINCNTGKDRSAQFAIVFGLLKDLKDVTSGKGQEEISKMIDEKDWAQELIDRALIMEKQTTAGGGIESINQTLLPKVTPELRQHREGGLFIYDSSHSQENGLTPLSKEEKTQVNEGIRTALKDYLRRQEEKAE